MSKKQNKSKMMLNNQKTLKYNNYSRLVKIWLKP